MTTAPTIDRDIKAYVAECELHLEDLEEPARRQLRVDIEEIVAEVCAELEGPPRELIGPPARFVAELRAAAGLGPPRNPDDAAARSGLRLRERLRGVRSHATVRWVRELLPQLQPAWWVVRGALVATVAARITGSGIRPAWLFGVMPYWPVLGSRLLGLAAIGGAIYVSVEAGRRRLRGWRRVIRAGVSIVAIVFALGVIGDVRAWSTPAIHPEPIADAYSTVALEPRSSVEENSFLVSIGSDVTGRHEQVVSLTDAQILLDELLQQAPPAVIYVEHQGERSNPGTRQAIESTLAALAEEGFLNP